MEGPLLWFVIGLIVIVAAGMGAALWDLSRSAVQHLPKWGWALVIVFVQFPIGAMLYLVVGRVADDGKPSPPTTPQATGVAPSMFRADEQRLTPSPVAQEPIGDVAAAVISTFGLRKVYGDAVALDGVDLAVPRGATYGLIGPNGAGKTTMLSILAGLRQPTAGELRIDVDRRQMAVLVDTPLFEPWLTAREVVDLARNLVAPQRPTDAVDAALAEVGLADAADRRCGGFSRGMLQRLGLATCLVGDPEVLLLDEPSSALDPAGRREVLDLIGRLAHSKTIVLSTHILGDVQQVCDVVGVIDRGMLRYQGPLEQLLAHTTTAYLVHVRAPANGLKTALAAQPWATEVDELAPGRLRLVTTDAATTERELPQWIASNGLALVSFYPATDLETAFLELTR